jgi:elongation factor P hydroxylase
VSEHHRIQDITTVFNQCFATEFNTRLVCGNDEPIYLPAGKTDIGIAAQDYAQVVFAHGYYASALHEIAHWCLAGKERRKKIDFGYWYCPDGRTAEQQVEFQKVEIKPQAIEWGLCIAAGFQFNVSCDNLSGDEFGEQPDHRAFREQVHDQVQEYLNHGFPTRAESLMRALSEFYQQTMPQSIASFSREKPSVVTERV